MLEVFFIAREMVSLAFKVVFKVDFRYSYSVGGNMIKLIASDLDGTLLNSEHTTDSRILSAIDEVISKGVIFVVATGRSLQGNQVEKLFGDREIYFISSNGALIKNIERETIYEQPVCPKFITDTLTNFPHMTFDFVGLNDTWINCSQEDYRNSLDTLNHTPESIERFLHGKYYNQSLEEILKHKIIKVNAKKREGDNFQKHIDRYEQVVNRPFSNTIYEITDHKVNKAAAIKILCNHLGIQDDEVAVFGDGGNDIEMLSYYHNSYTVENGVENAKKVATHLLGPSDSYSVITKIQELINHQD